MTLSLTPRLIIRLIVLTALGLLSVWIARHTYWDHIKLPTSFTGAAATNPWYVAEQLTHKLGVPSQHLSSTQDLPTATHHVIYLHDWNWGLIAQRQQRLQHWVASGGRLVMDDSVYGYDDELRRWLGVTTVYPKPDDAEKDTASPDTGNEPPNKSLGALLNAPCPGFELSGANTVLMDSPGYRFCGLADDSHLDSSRKAQWTASNHHGIQVLRLSVGKGQVTVINGEPFTNRLMLRADNALLFAAAGQLQRGDQIDWLTEPESASLLALVWRHGAPVVIALLLCVFLVLWRQATRFGPLAMNSAAPRRSLKEQIRGTSAFLLRMGDGCALHQACANALQRSAQQRIAHYTRVDSQQRLQLLAQHTRLAEDELRAALYLHDSASRHDLTRSMRLLEMARRRIESHSINASS